jgi:hypothetical protein
MSAVFGVVSLTHIAQAAAYKTGFCWVVIMGVLWQFGGYFTRALATRHQQSSGLVTVSQLLILLSPLCKAPRVLGVSNWSGVNAFDYMLLARMIHFFVPSQRIFLKPSFLAVIFVCLDFVSFVIQLVGGGMATPGSKDVMKGIHIYQGMLIIAVVWCTNMCRRHCPTRNFCYHLLRICDQIPHRNAQGGAQRHSRRNQN